jgi:hypothetical protein
VPDEYTYKTQEDEEFDMFEEIPDEINHNTEDDDFDLFDV